MRYNSVGSILEKTQLHQRSSSGSSWQEQKKKTYQQAYVYSQEQSHTAIYIGNQTYSYDSNGNRQAGLMTRADSAGRFSGTKRTASAPSWITGQRITTSTMRKAKEP